MLFKPDSDFFFEDSIRIFSVMDRIRILSFRGFPGFRPAYFLGIDTDPFELFAFFIIGAGKFSIQIRNRGVCGLDSDPDPAFSLRTFLDADRYYFV